MGRRSPVIKEKLTAKDMAELPPLLDEEVELSMEEARDGGGIDPRFLAEIFPQMRGMLERSDPIVEVGEDIPRVAEPMAMQDQEEEKTTAVFKRRLASLVREVAVAQQSGGPVVRASALAVAGDGSKGVHSRVLANAKQFWGLKASEARGKFEAFAAVYYHFGRRASTLASQASAVRCWEWFADTYEYPLYPANLESLTAWVVFNSTRISVASIKAYISSLRSHHVTEGYTMPDNKEMPQLNRILDGLSWVEKAKKGGRLRLPCTLQVLRTVLETKVKNAVALDEESGKIGLYSMESWYMASAVYSFAFGGGFRPSEFTVRENEAKKYTSNALRLKDLSYNVTEEGVKQSLVVLLPKRKTDQLGEKSDVVIGRIGDPLVEPIDNLEDYLSARRAGGEVLTGESLLFPVKGADGTLHGLTYQELTKGMNADLAKAGFDPSLYQGHSWRIGMATTLAMNGVPEYIIKDMGGWSRNSSAFNVYIKRCPQEQRAVFAQFLATPFNGQVVAQSKRSGLHPSQLY